MPRASVSTWRSRGILRPSGGRLGPSNTAGVKAWKPQAGKGLDRAKDGLGRLPLQHGAPVESVDRRRWALGCRIGLVRGDVVGVGPGAILRVIGKAPGPEVVGVPSALHRVRVPGDVDAEVERAVGEILDRELGEEPAFGQ